VYYSDISNSELQQFHNQKVQNFTIKLSDALTSPLFKIEEVIAGNVYKIYPLFYANEITSTNPNDKILDNKCIICQKQTDENTNKETYFSFISDPDSEINDYTEYGQYYDIGDSLTTNEFNAIISLLRQNTINTGQFELNNGTLHGAYADYEFDIEDSTLLDTGIVVTDETITAQPRVKLTNPLFKWSKYLLKLDVIHYTGVNVLDDETGDFKVVETLEVELVKDEWVDIPVSSFEEGYIISLTANIEISHNEPIIRMLKGLRVTGNPEIIQSNETTDLTAQLLDQNGYDYDVSESEGITVHFYEIITPSLTGLIANPNIIAIDETSDITVQVMDEDGSKVTGETVHFYAVKGIDPTPGHSYRLVVESDVDVLSYYDEDSASLSATLTDNNVPVDGEVVSFEVRKQSDDSLVETLTGTTNSQGVATVSYVSKGTGDLNIHCEALQGSLVSEICVIQDCILYDGLTSDSGKWTVPSGVTSTYSSDGWRVSANAYKQIKLTEKLTSDCSVEFTVADYSSTRDMAIIVYAYTNGETTPNQQILTGGSTVASDWKVLGSTIDHNMIKGGVYRIEYTNSTLKVYENDVLLGSASNNVGLPTRFEFHTSSNRWAIYKDLKIKPL
jgi:hypothetical protein